jgi:YebC/PmpR family DNA-binding regulatory protein
LSGHSKWATIHRQKEAADRKRGRLFSKLSRAIAVAARQGVDPEINFKLRLAIEKARQANMPKENIERAVRSAQGKLKGGGLEEVVYEGFGPAKVAVIVEAVTDNRNRTTAEIKNLFEKAGGSLAAPGAVACQFKQAGLLTVPKGKRPEERILQIMDFGPEDVQEVSDAIEVYTRAEKLAKFKNDLEASGFRVTSSELISQPLVTIKITDETKAKKILKFMDQLQDQEDVQKVFANFDMFDKHLEEGEK